MHFFKNRAYMSMRENEEYKANVRSYMKKT